MSLITRCSYTAVHHSFAALPSLPDELDPFQVLGEERWGRVTREALFSEVRTQQEW